MFCALGGPFLVDFPVESDILKSLFCHGVEYELEFRNKKHLSQKSATLKLFSFFFCVEKKTRDQKSQKV